MRAWTYRGSRGQRGLYSRVGVDAALVGETIRSYGRGTTNNGGGQNRFRYCGHGRIPLRRNALDNQLCCDSTPFDLKTRSANWSAAWHAALSEFSPEHLIALAAVPLMRALSDPDHLEEVGVLLHPVRPDKP